MFGGEKTNKKTVAISLILLTVLSATIGALLIMSTASANDVSATNAATSVGTNTSAISEVNQTLGMQPLGNFMMPGDQGFGGNPNGPAGQGQMFMGDNQMMQNIEISSAFNATINSIIDNDTNVQNLVNQGYNVTAINPIIHNVVTGDGTVSTEATTATVLMQNGTSGFATINVDIANAKVTQIVIVTRTVIDESGS